MTLFLICKMQGRFEGRCSCHDEIENEEVNFWTCYVCFFGIMCIACSVETCSRCIYTPSAVHGGAGRNSGSAVAGALAIPSKIFPRGAPRPSCSPGTDSKTCSSLTLTDLLTPYHTTGFRLVL